MAKTLIGTVKVLWAFADKPTETIELVCHVLERCSYNVILGGKFLWATKTLTQYRHRFTMCLRSLTKRIRVSLLNESRQYLQGMLKDNQKVYAVPDTGAEGNIIDLQYAEHFLFITKLAYELQICGRARTRHQARR